MSDKSKSATPGTIKAVILRMLRDEGPASSMKMTDVIGVNMSASMIRMASERLIYDTGERVARGIAKKPARVYAISAVGRAALAEMERPRSETALSPAIKSIVVRRWNEWRDIGRIAREYGIAESMVAKFLADRPGYPGHIVYSRASAEEKYAARADPTPDAPLPPHVVRRRGVSLYRVPTIDGEPS